MDPTGTPRKTNMTTENQPFEDVSPTKKWVIFHGYVRFRGCRPSFASVVIPWGFITH